MRAMTILEIIICFVVALFSFYWRYIRIHVPIGLKLPPGPPRRFLIGNLRDIPLRKEWETYHFWKKTFGDLVYLNIFGKSLLLVNSEKLVSELFDVRGALYSDRFPSTMLCDLGGFDWSLALRAPDEVWKHHRSILQQHLNKTSMVQYQATLERCSTTLLSLLFRKPAQFLEHSRHILGAMILEITYGIQIQSENDHYIEVAEKAMEIFGEISTPGAYLVDIFPFMKYIPAWVPGTIFKQKAEELKSKFTLAKDTPFAAVEKALKAGVASPSIVANFLEARKLEDSSEKSSRGQKDGDEEVIKSIGAVIFLAGIDTTEAAIQIFLMAMILYPDIQKAAQEELDRVVGSNSFPTFNDRPNLPYINALCKEVLRWHSVTPVGFPHVLKQDDVIGEYFVPKGTIVMGNTWSLSHSESIYGPDVDRFNPQRFLEKDSKNPDFAFGYGRRICPGRHLADSMMFIIIASILHVFDIEREGPGLPCFDDFIPGIISRAKPFACRITPRTPVLISLLEQISDV